MARRPRWIYLVALCVSLTALAEQPKEYATTARTGTYVVKPTYSDAQDFSEGLAAVQVGDAWGFIDTTGKLVIERFLNPKQGFNSRFSDGLCAVNFQPGGQDAKWGFIDRTGKVVINPQFDADRFHPPFFSEGLAAVFINGKWGYINTAGRIVIEPQFTEALWFANGLAAVRNNDWKWGYIDKTGKYAIQPTLSTAASFSNGLAWVQIDDEHDAYLDPSGKLIPGPPGVSLGPLTDGMAQVFFKKRPPKDAKGSSVASENEEDASFKYGFADKTGQVVIPPQFEPTFSNMLIGDFSEGLALVEFGSWRKGDHERHGQKGFIDKTGAIAIAPKYDDAWGFTEGLAAVKIGNMWGYIDKTGRQIVPTKFDDASSFSDGLARVRVGDKYGYIVR